MSLKLSVGNVITFSSVELIYVLFNTKSGKKSNLKIQSNIVQINRRGVEHGISWNSLPYLHVIYTMRANRKVSQKQNMLETDLA